MSQGTIFPSPYMAYLVTPAAYWGLLAGFNSLKRTGLSSYALQRDIRSPFDRVGAS
jgi:hypothetical protein